MTDIFRAKIVDVQPRSLTIEITGNESKVEKFLALMDDLWRRRVDPHRENRPGPQTVAREVITIHHSTFKIPIHIMPAKVYTDKDADLKHLQNKTLAVLGFGSQGHAHALNLKDSGCKVIIGLYEGSKSIPVAQAKGFEVVSTAEAVRRADVIFVAIPDTKQAGGLRARHRAQSGPGQDAAVLARLFDSFQDHRPAARTSTSSSSRPKGRATSSAASIWKAKACPP